MLAVTAFLFVSLLNETPSNKRKHTVKSDMYSTFATEYDEAVQDNIYNANLERPALQSMLPALRNLNVVELGCGSGIYAQYLLAQGAAKVTCIDYSEDMIQLVI